MSNVIIEPPDKKIPGVKPKFADKIYQQLLEGKRSFGDSGAALTHYALSPKYRNLEGLNMNAVEDSIESEREVTRFLTDWAKKYPNVVIVDSLRIPDWKPPKFDPEVGYPEDVALSHAIVMGNEIVLVDTKRWTKGGTINIADDGSIVQEGNSFPGNKLRILETIDGWLNYLDDGAIIAMFVCVNNDDTEITRDRNFFKQEYRLVEIDRMEETLDRWVERIPLHDKERIETTLISQLAARTIKPYSAYNRLLDTKILRKFR